MAGNQNREILSNSSQLPYRLILSQRFILTFFYCVISVPFCESKESFLINAANEYFMSDFVWFKVKMVCMVILPVFACEYEI